jgi:hypothetical protein
MVEDEFSGYQIGGKTWPTRPCRSGIGFDLQQEKGSIVAMPPGRRLEKKLEE